MRWVWVAVAVAVLLLGAESAPPRTIDHAAVIQQFQDGVGTASIATRLGCSRRHVQQVVSDAGLLPNGVRPLHARLQEVVRFEVSRHGPNYGWAMLRGALQAHYPEWRWPRGAVTEVLRELNPQAHSARRFWRWRRLPRGIYVAPYFMYSMHIDLACKIQEYHIFVGACLDGCTRRVLHLSAFTNKLPYTVYNELFEPVAREFGLPDQMVSDKGPEFCIAAFVCLFLARICTARLSERRPHRCVPSKRNVSWQYMSHEALSHSTWCAADGC